MQDRNGADPGYLVPGTWYLAPVSNSHISNLNKAVGACSKMSGGILPATHNRSDGVTMKSWDTRSAFYRGESQNVFKTKVNTHHPG
jgi:hypothetical protein